MAKKYGADSTLVAAAYRLGQSYGPKDYTEIFKLQYEGLAAAHKGKMEMYGKMSEGIMGHGEKLIEHKKAEDKYVEDQFAWFEEAEKASTDWVDGKMKENADHYEKGGFANPQQQQADEDYMSSLKEKLETLQKKPKIFLSKEEKQKLKKVKQNIEQFQNQWNNSYGELNTAGNAWTDNLINKGLSFKGDIDKQLLFGLIYDPKVDLKKMGVKVSWENGEKIYEYPEGMMGVIAGENKGTGKKLKVSQKDLISGISYKDTKTESDFNAIDKSLINDATKQTNVEGKGKVYSVDLTEDLAKKIKKDYKDAALKSSNPNDIYTRELTVGNTTRVYKDDLLSNTNIDVAVINQMGIGSDVFTAEELRDGKIDPTELAKHEDARDKIIEILTNPKTDSQREIAADNYAQYRKDTLFNAIQNERTRLEEKELPQKTIETIPTTTTLFGKSVPIATTADERKTFAIVNNIAGGKLEVTVKGATYTYDPKTETYSYFV